MSEYTFIIKSCVETDEDGSPLFWNSEDGWVDLESATTYTEEETDWMNLPAQSVWNYKVVATDIDWDTSDTEGDIPVLPKSFTMACNEFYCDEEIQETICDELSDRYGFCIKSLSIQ
jgi:hypothetical protein